MTTQHVGGSERIGAQAEQRTETLAQSGSTSEARMQAAARQYADAELDTPQEVQAAVEEIGHAADGILPFEHEKALEQDASTVETSQAEGSLETRIAEASHIESLAVLVQSLGDEQRHFVTDLGFTVNVDLIAEAIRSGNLDAIYDSRIKDKLLELQQASAELEAEDASPAPVEKDATAMEDDAKILPVESENVASDTEYAAERSEVSEQIIRDAISRAQSGSELVTTLVDLEKSTGEALELYDSEYNMARRIDIAPLAAAIGRIDHAMQMGAFYVAERVKNEYLSYTEPGVEIADALHRLYPEPAAQTDAKTQNAAEASSEKQLDTAATEDEAIVAPEIALEEAQADDVKLEVQKPDAAPKATDASNAVVEKAENVEPNFEEVLAAASDADQLIEAIRTVPGGKVKMKFGPALSGAEIATELEKKRANPRKILIDASSIGNVDVQQAALRLLREFEADTPSESAPQEAAAANQSQPVPAEAPAPQPVRPVESAAERPVRLPEAVEKWMGERAPRLGAARSVDDLIDIIRGGPTRDPRNKGKEYYVANAKGRIGDPVDTEEMTEMLKAIERIGIGVARGYENNPTKLIDLVEQDDFELARAVRRIVQKV